MATDIIRVRTVLSGWSGGPGLNTFYFGLASGSLTNTEAADVVARVRAFWFAIKAMFPSTFTATVNPAVDTLDIASGNLTGGLAGGSPAVVTGTSAQGFGATPAMILMRGATGSVVNGRRLVTRSFIGPVDSNQDSNGNPSSTATGLIVTGSASLLTGSSAAFVGAWHRPVSGAGGVFRGVSAYTCAPTFAVLRSRRD